MHELPEEYRIAGGGTLRLGTASGVDARVQYTVTVAAWEGERYSLYTFAYNASSADLLALLNRVRLTESAEGVTLVPRQPASTPIASVYLLKEVPTLGLLSIRPLDRDLVRHLPAWRGQQVTGGELFIYQDDPDERGFVLVNETTHTHVIPDPGRDLNALLPALAELQVDWTKDR